MRRARLSLPAAASLAALLSLPVTPAAQPRDGARAVGARGLWFDPTQLPRFTGIVERYLPAPAGGFDSLLLREGVQVLFPPELAEAMRQAVPAGRPILVWGIRARSAAVVTMLAWAPTAEEEPRLVERPSWLGGLPSHGQARIAVSGTVRQPLHNSRGEVNGALLEDGTVIRLPAEAAAARLDLLRPGARLAAMGSGIEGEGVRALAAESLGDGPQSMTPVAEGAGTPPRR